MDFQRPHYCLFFVLFSLLCYYSQAYIFYAGGRDGWVLNPSENYNQWAGRNRFQVNDIIVFKYNKGSNSVLLVNKDDYDKCNTTNPIKKFEDGDTEFKFDRSGPFHFISGEDGNCQKGQKLIVVVLAVRGPKLPNPPPPSVSPSPVSQPPVAHQPPSPAPAISPSAPAPASIPPAISPSPATSPPPSPSAKTPASTPTSSPSPATSAPRASPPSPPVSTPSPAPSSSSTPGSSQTPSASPLSSNETAPSPPSGGSASWAVAPSSLLMYSVTIVLGAALSEVLGAQ